MAARRTQVGLRRRRPGLTSPLSSHEVVQRVLRSERTPAPRPRFAPSLALAAGLAWALGPGCLGLSDQDTNVLSLHLQNSTMFFQRGSYRQSMHQADMALNLDSSHVGMRIIKGFCLTKLGAMQGTVDGIDEAIELFDDLKHGAGSDDYRTWLGSGEAHMTRALRHQQQLERIERRLMSDFLTDEARKFESDQYDLEHEEREDNLEVAEHDLRRVLQFPLHSDNTYAMMDLVVVLNMRGTRDDESGAIARRTIELLVQGIELTRETLNDTLRLSPTKRVDLQRRVKEDLEKERQLRQVLVAIEFERGSYQRCLDELAALEERQLMDLTDHQLRADIYESIGMLPDALDELEVFLRLRARDAKFDDVARETLRRIDELQEKIAASP